MQPHHVMKYCRVHMSRTWGMTSGEVLERVGDGLPEGRDIADLVGEHECKAGEEERLFLFAGRVDGSGKRLIGRFEVVEGHLAHGVAPLRQICAVRSTSAGMIVFQRPAMWR